ncbi:uncharacterized protein P174DRAFT_35382 [Aspergillus novofumigatus IBT 16806]|uniref:Uncharacterized protein n=1 Tax=Aspergillus novofumigatus (strain IBT 16806) TaxID=1392255 RepID=A0A2I1CN30_ASPN1|nr:uncharacterized protein P174DRAFT_35382 [Aspergillus novofumigatus IBT 16806]PKX98995.1 hypothetical protein P174DRAFT_35382 [Aspergillus novofumigatus IBT 16806]
MHNRETTSLKKFKQKPRPTWRISRRSRERGSLHHRHRLHHFSPEQPDEDNQDYRTFDGSGQVPSYKKGTIHRRVMEIHPSPLNRGLFSFLFSFSFRERRSFEKEEEELSLPVVYLMPFPGQPSACPISLLGRRKSKDRRRRESNDAAKRKQSTEREEQKEKKKKKLNTK